MEAFIQRSFLRNSLIGAGALVLAYESYKAIDMYKR